MLGLKNANKKINLEIFQVKSFQSGFLCAAFQPPVFSLCIPFPKSLFYFQKLFKCLFYD